eukprot:2327508-Pleurochrysis_carterae.AAC.1
MYTIGTTAALQRQVCRSIFLAHYPLSPATLDPLITRKAKGLPAYDRDVQCFEANTKRDGREAMRAAMDQLAENSLSVIGWWLAYMPRCRRRNCRMQTR